METWTKRHSVQEVTGRQQLETFVAAAELPALLAALAYLEGGPDIIHRLGFNLPQSGPTTMPIAQGGLTEEQQMLARRICVDVLLRYEAHGYPTAKPIAREKLAGIVQFLTGTTDEDYLALLEDELALPTYESGRGSSVTDLSGSNISVVVVGAGMSGLAAAYRLREAGINFIVLEKNEDVGGTWYENRYPGCRLDTSNFAYSYSFNQKSDWPDRFSKRDDIWRYFREVAAEAGLRDHIKFGHTVSQMTFNEDDQTWEVVAHNNHGDKLEITANIVVPAVGQLNKPNWPNLPGMSEFAGSIVHTASWPHKFDVMGKRVGVIGSGASAYQVVPGVVDDASELVVFQRSAPWMLPTADYHEEIREGLRWLFENVPEYHRWYRFWQFWTTAEGRLPFVKVDPEWNSDKSVSALNDRMRVELTQHIVSQFSDRPDLLPHVVPNYPPGAKRLLRDNGVWADALKRDKTTLVTQSIVGFDRDGIKTIDGRHYDLDVVVLATGFKASDILMPIKVTGIDGVDLHEQWAGDAQAFLGMCVPNFPNLFMLFGPNSGVAVNGSVIFMSECSVDFMMASINQLIDGNKSTMMVRPDRFEEYNRHLDDANRAMAWGRPGVTNWYKNDNGRVTANWPFSLRRYWELTRSPAAHDFIWT